MDQYLDHGEEDGDGLPPQKWKSILAAATSSDNPSVCFDCNICLDSALDPVVTLCGHLYCWPCIYKWLHNEESASPEQQQQCPVCKTSISQTTLVPLYGRGQSSSSRTEFKQKPLPFPSLDIPRRPPACGVHALLTTNATTTSRPSLRRSQSQHHQYYPSYYNNYNVEESLPPTTPTTPSALHPLVGMFGEMIQTRVFGNSEGSLYWYPNSYNHIEGSSPRVRRQEMQVARSLNRVSIFLFCCVVLCLILF